MGIADMMWLSALQVKGKSGHLLLTCNPKCQRDLSEPGAEKTGMDLKIQGNCGREPRWWRE